METIYLVLIFSTVGGLLSLSIAIALLSRKSITGSFIRYATPFAAGALLSAVFLDLLKEGSHIGDTDSLLLATLIGILTFFLAEKLLHWFHHHHDEDVDSKKATKNLIIFGDLAHNALDGVAIGAAFLISPATGIVTALAVAAHEIPQEVGEFGLLLGKGMRRKNVLIVNVVSSLGTILAAVLVYLIGADDKLPIEALLGLSAGFLLYIAMSDIIPTIHSNSNKKKLIDVQPLLLLLGVIIVGVLITFSHGFIDHGDDHGHAESTFHDESIEHEEEHPDEVHSDEINN